MNLEFVNMLTNDATCECERLLLPFWAAESLLLILFEARLVIAFWIGLAKKLSYTHGEDKSSAS